MNKITYFDTLIIGDSMNSLDYIEITINKISDPIEIIIDINNNLITVNDTQQIIFDNKIEELLRIIKFWKNYGSSNKIDDEKFMINLRSKNNEETIYSHGLLPKNYNEFKKWMSEFNG